MIDIAAARTLDAAQPAPEPGRPPEGDGPPTLAALPDVPVLLWSAGPDGGRDAFNPAWLSWTGRNAGAETGEGWLDGVDPEDRERLRSFYADHRGTGDLSVEYRLRNRDGLFRRIRETARPRFREDGAFAGFLGAGAVLDEEDAPADALAEAARTLREAQHRARNTVQVTLSLLNLYGRAIPPDAKDLFNSLVRRIRAIGIVGGGLPEGEGIATVDLLDYLQRIAGPLANLHAAGASVTVEGARAELPPPRVHAIGMVMAEVLAACLRPAERRREGVRVLVGEPSGAELRIAVAGEAADEPDAPAKLGERLTAAYAVRAGAELRRSEGLIELVVAVG